MAELLGKEPVEKGLGIIGNKRETLELLLELEGAAGAGVGRFDTRDVEALRGAEAVGRFYLRGVLGEEDLAHLSKAIDSEEEASRNRAPFADVVGQALMAGWILRERKNIYTDVLAAAREILRPTVAGARVKII